MSLLMNDKTWLCPLCALVRMPYGKSCNRPDTCGNPIHITGRAYVNDDGTLKSASGAQGVGISEIANKDGDSDLLDD